MNTTKTGIIILIKCAITGESLTLPEGFYLQDAYDEIVRHSIGPMAYTGAALCGIPKDDHVMKKLFAIYIKQMMKSEAQMSEAARVFKAFDENGIDYLPLKGLNLKGLYPKPELRQMGDADILIKEEQYPVIKGIVERLGFEFKYESDHELVWINDKLFMELHKHLIPSYNKDYYEYFAKGWQLAWPANTADSPRHKFKSAEDEFIFIFTHFAKHYRDGGIGLRHIIDLWVYMNAYPEMDEAYIDAILERLQLLEFYNNILGLIDAWFKGGRPNEKTDFISEYIFSSGNWGGLDAHLLSAIVKETQTSTADQEYNKARHILRRAFPDKEFMVSYFPFLKKCPFVYPVFWPVRHVHALLFKRDSIKRQWDTYTAVDQINSFEDALAHVGLRFNFKDKD